MNEAMSQKKQPVVVSTEPLEYKTVSWCNARALKTTFITFVFYLLLMVLFYNISVMNIVTTILSRGKNDLDLLDVDCR